MGNIRSKLFLLFFIFPAISFAQFNFFFSQTRGCAIGQIKLPNALCGSNNNILTLTQPIGGGLTLSSPNPVSYNDSRTITYTPPVGYTLSSWSGDCTGVGSGNSCLLQNIRGNKSISVNVSCSQGFLFNSPTNTCLPMDSCKTLLTNFPSYVNQDGLYDIVNPTSGEVYKAYCDMSTSGGGWTLLFSPDSTTQYNTSLNYNSSNPIWVGNDARVITKDLVFNSGSVSASKIKVAGSYSLLDQQKAVKNVKFTQLNMFMYALTSSENSTFATKFTNKTSWSYTTAISGLSLCVADAANNKWDVSQCTTNTCHQAVLGCRSTSASFGGDVTTLFALGGVSNRNSHYSCGSNGGQSGSAYGDTAGQQYWCGTYYLLSNPGHRGGTVFGSNSDKNNMVWGR